MIAMDDTNIGGSMTITDVGAGTPQMDAIAAQVAEPVWALMRAGEKNAVSVLLAANAARFYAAWLKESVGITPRERSLRPVETCTSPHHDGLDCPTALATGQLKEHLPFCGYCSQRQLDMTPAPQTVTETGSLVHIVTPTGTTSARRRRKVS